MHGRAHRAPAAGGVTGLAEAVARRPWRAVAVLVVVAAAVRFVLAERMPGPWIFADEFIYSELAKNLTEGRLFAVRDQQVLLTAVVPFLDAPGYLLGSVSAALTWIHGVNAVVMAAAVIPAYGLARMATGVWPSLAFAVLVAAWPAHAYTGSVMTEPAFFTACLFVTWALARAVERPTRRRQLVAVAVIAASLLVRVQSVVFLACAVAVVAVVAATTPGEAPWARRAAGVVRRHAVLLAGCVAIPVLAVAAQVARGNPVRSVLGGYQVLDESSAAAGDVWTWGVRHLAVVALSMFVAPAVIGIAALIRGYGRGFRGDGPSAVLHTVGVVCAALLVQVAVFAAAHALRVEERNLLAVEPLLLLAAVVGVCATGYGGVATAVAAAAVGLAAWTLPIDALLSPPPLSDTFTVVALGHVAEVLGVAPGDLVRAVVIAGLGMVAGMVIARRRHVALIMPPVVLAVLVVLNAALIPRLESFANAVAGATGGTSGSWIDEAAGRDARVAFLWPGDADPKLAWQAEFWNRSVRTVVAVGGPMPTLETAHADVDPVSGRFVWTRGSTPPPEDLVVAPARWTLRGARVGSARVGAGVLVLWRAERPLRLASASSGFYEDGWTTPATRAVAYDCAGGSFRWVLRLGFGARQRVTVTPSGAPPRNLVLVPGPARTVTVPAAPTAEGVCTVEMTVADTATGDEIAGNGDARLLGVLAAPPTFRPSPGS